jgi:DNA-directed RNA polymerase specialized sigma24 family protein
MTTVKALYQRYTGDTSAHQRTIDARYRKLPDRARRVIHGATLGLTLRALAQVEGCSHGTVNSLLKRSMEAIRKDVHHEPRYNKIGKGRNKPKDRVD